MDNDRATKHLNLANNYAETAYWQVKAIDRDAADRLGIAEAVQELLGLLQKVDDATIDIISFLIIILTGSCHMPAA